MPSTMTRILASRSCAALCLLLAGAAAAQDVDKAAPPAGPASAAGPSTPDAAASTATETPRQDNAPAASKQNKFEGAIGLILSYEPEFSGGSKSKIKPNLAGFIRYGRFTVTGAGGFTTKRQDDVERGLDAELVRRGQLRMNLSLRYDPGRKESASDDLAGMGDIKATVRARLGVRWEPVPNWQLSASMSSDILGRNGGYTTSFGVARTFPLTSTQRLILATGLTAAGDRYLQTWYGVTAAQSATSGYPVYTPRSGLRDVGVGLTWREEINSDWAAFVGTSASRLLGPAADSPLVKRPNGWGLSAGIARRF